MCWFLILKFSSSCLAFARKKRAREILSSGFSSEEGKSFHLGNRLFECPVSLSRVKVGGGGQGCWG